MGANVITVAKFQVDRLTAFGLAKVEIYPSSTTSFDVFNTIWRCRAAAPPMIDYYADVCYDKLTAGDSSQLRNWIVF